ncbi:MAG: flagella synthesis protein FlgN [Steroidobacteraceae bacterium]
MAAAGVPSVDAGVCREHLGTLLTEEIAALRELEDLLKREHEVLGAQNVAAIERTAVVRQQMMCDLARTEEQRRSLCTMHGYTPDWHGLESLMRWCDQEGTLLSRLRECARRATQCRDLNDKNGILVAARLKHVEGRLAALNGGANQAVTYGPKGAAPKPNRSHEWGAA